MVGLRSSSVVWATVLLQLASFTSRALAASGRADLYLQNDALDSDPDRSLNNIAYYLEYYIGTPPRRFLGCVDTGSSDTWVPANTCTSSVCQSHDQYDPSASSSDSNTSTQPVIIRYGTGSVGATLVYETVSLANITVMNQGIAMATALTFDFASTSCDGLVGLGFQYLSSTGARPIFQTAVAEDILTDQLFTLWLSPTPGVEPAGLMTFGSIDQTKYTGQLRYIDLVREAYWQVPLDSVQVGGSEVNFRATTAIIDSGTTAIVLSNSDASSIHNQIPGARFWSAAQAYNVTCNVNTLPNVTFVFDGQSFSVPPRLYVQQLSDQQGNSLDVCVSAIVGGGGSGSYAVLGTNFLRAWYTVYTVAGGNAQVGFAAATGQSATASGGRKLKHAGEERLFRAAPHQLHNHKWGSEARRRLGEQEQQDASPVETRETMFTRSADSVGFHRWGEHIVDGKLAGGE